MPSAKRKKSKSKKKENYKKYFIHYAYCLAIISLLILTGVNINKYIENQKVLGAKIDISPLQEEKNYWENLITDHPTFVDAYLQLAKVEVEIGDKEKAINLIKKALTLDPNETKIIEVQEELGL